MSHEIKASLEIHPIVSVIRTEDSIETKIFIAMTTMMTTLFPAHL